MLNASGWGKYVSDSTLVPYAANTLAHIAVPLCLSRCSFWIVGKFSVLEELIGYLSSWIFFC